MVDVANVRPLLVCLGVALTRVGLLFFTKGLAHDEAKVLRRQLYCSTGSFRTMDALPSVPQDVRRLSTRASNSGANAARWDMMFASRMQGCAESARDGSL